MKSKAILDLVSNISEDQAIDSIKNAYKKNAGFYSVGFLNQYGFNLISSHTDIEFYFSQIDLLFRDGIGIKIANKIYGIQNSDNLNGTDLIPKILDSVNEKANYFVFGTKSPWLQQGAQKLLKGHKFKALDGFKSENEYIEYLENHIDINSKTVIVLAMGMPKQEKLAHAIKTNIKGSGIIICGGAIIDFNAGKVKRAPKLFRQLSLEWLYRLIIEPRRLFKRYVIGIPVFFIKLIVN